MACNCGQNTFRKFLPGFTAPQRPEPKIIKKSKKEIKEKLEEPKEENVPQETTEENAEQA